MELLIQEAGKCVNCGFCESVCPTLPASSFIASIGARGRVDIAKFVYKNGTVIDPSTSFYSCVDCYACVAVCPAGVNAGKVSEIGRQIVAKSGNAPEVAKMIVQITMLYKNPLAVREMCAKWATGIDFDKSSTILYTGNMYQLMAYLKSFSRVRKMIGSYDAKFARLIRERPSLIRALSRMYDRKMMDQMSIYLRNIVNALKKAGIKFGYLGEEEPYPGTFIYDLGFMDDFVSYAQYVSNLFREHGVERIITVDPHTYELLKYIYPRYVKFDFDVVYYLELIEPKKLEGRYAVHTPCHFSRYFDFTSFISKFIDVSPDTGQTKCCGGPDELLFPQISENISQRRFSELKAEGLPIITACPICYANLAKDDTVYDISALI
ncbi:(Fe-S)-binding protein [Thermoplasma volcanium]|nr:(Fe-S)-binding protein [Thermoplasma volcanium]